MSSTQEEQFAVGEVRTADSHRMYTSRQDRSLVDPRLACACCGRNALRAAEHSVIVKRCGKQPGQGGR
jgi:hypothetical protein